MYTLEVHKPPFHLTLEQPQSTWGVEYNVHQYLKSLPWIDTTPAWSSTPQKNPGRRLLWWPGANPWFQYLVPGWTTLTPYLVPSSRSQRLPTFALSSSVRCLGRAKILAEGGRTERRDEEGGGRGGKRVEKKRAAFCWCVLCDGWCVFVELNSIGCC